MTSNFPFTDEVRYRLLHYRFSPIRYSKLGVMRFLISCSFSKESSMKILRALKMVNVNGQYEEEVWRQFDHYLKTA